MCGICGIVDLNNKISDKKKLTDKMSEKLTHRGPDDSGSFNDNLVSFGFKRLSILDVKNGNQPMMNKNKTIISIFNGEIYNFKGIKKELEKKGHSFYSNSDSEIIPYAYQEWGINFVKKINGMFSIAIYDKVNKSVYFIRDRIGIKPLYFFKHNESIFFSSEINSITSVPFFKKKINYRALSSYLSFRYPTEDDENFFDGLKRLSSGTFMKITTDKSLNIKYWDIPHPQTTKIHKESYYLEKLDYLLNLSVQRQLISDVPLGVFLSGGLDSSILSAIAVKYTGKNLSTYSVTLPGEGYDESEKAKLVSKYLQTNHNEIFLEKTNFLENLNKLINIKGVPGSIPHEYALYLLSKEMKKKITVVLSGEGADEFFGGYSRVQKSPFDYLKLNFLKKLGFNSSKFNNFYEFIMSRYNWFSPEQKNKLLNIRFKEQSNYDEKLNQSWNKFLDEGSLSENYNKVLYMFQSKHLKCLLDRLDTMTMASGIEARVPFLDHELIEFINTVPFEYKIKWKSNFHKILSLGSTSEKYTEKNDINKYLLRKLSRKYIPKKISRAKKLGFPVPLNEWIKDIKIKNMILGPDSLSKEFYNKEELEKVFQMQDNKEFDFSGKKVWMLLNVELWMRQNFD